MAPEAPITSFHAHVAAALDGLRGVPLSDLEPGGLLVVLTVLGDAVRLGVAVPGPVMRAAEALSEDAFRAVFGALVTEVAAWSLPAEPAPDEEHAGYDWAIRQRDEAESVVVAARRILTPRGILLDGLEEARAFESAILGRDFTCGGKRGREDAERALGERVVLATGGSWVERLPDLEREDEGNDVAEDSPVGAPVTTAPSDESVDAYVTRGELVRWIEGAARRSPTFAEELAATIEAGIACRSTVGLVARRWLRSRDASPSALPLAVLPRARWAAADDDAEIVAPSTTVGLGALHPLDAVASLTLAGDRATLQVSAAPGVDLVSIRFGGAITTAADEEGLWRVTALTTSDVLDLRVEAKDGGVFRETVRLEPET